MNQDHSENKTTEATASATYLPKNDYGLGFPLDRTALLVIDPVNDFLSEGGAAYDLTKNTLKLNDVVGNLRRAIDGARATGVPVIFGPMAYTEEDYADEELQRKTGINRIMFERKEKIGPPAAQVKKLYGSRSPDAHNHKSAAQTI